MFVGEIVFYVAFGVSLAWYWMCALSDTRYGSICARGVAVAFFAVATILLGSLNVSDLCNDLIVYLFISIVFYITYTITIDIGRDLLPETA